MLNPTSPATTDQYMKSPSSSNSPTNMASKQGGALAQPTSQELPGTTASATRDAALDKVAIEVSEIRDAELTKMEMEIKSIREAEMKRIEREVNEAKQLLLAVAYSQALNEIAERSRNN